MPASVLSFGRDTNLLQSRGLVLARAGAETVNVQTLNAFRAAVLGNGFDLVTLCHTLSSEESRRAYAHIRSHNPLTSILVFRAGAPRSHPYPGVSDFDVHRGPAALISEVQHLLLPGMLSRLPEGGPLWPSTKGK